jgi:hypothetical protein
MNILEFNLLVSAGIVALAVAIDFGCEIWEDKRAERKAMIAKRKEAVDLLHQALVKHVEKHDKTIAELEAVTLPKKPAGGRHRLTAA